MNILVTGITGFVGKNLTAHIAEGNVLYGLSRTPAAEASAYKQYDYNQLAVINNEHIDAIIHLAGKAHDIKKVSKPDEYYEVNTELTKKLFDAFLASDAKKFIFISSVKAAADSVPGVLNEDITPEPYTHYGKSKLLAEQYIQSQQLPTGKSVYILRPCMIHGPGNKGNLNLLYQFVTKGLPYPLAAFKNERSFLSVDNLCFIIKELLTRNDIASGIYNVADDQSLSTTEVVSLLSEATGKSPKLLAINEKSIRMLARMGDRLKLPLNTERLNKLTENYVVSNRKIKLALNKQLPLTAREGILKTALSFKHA